MTTGWVAAIGEAEMVDASKSGEVKTAAAGDVIHVVKGTTLTLTTTKESEG